MDINYLINLWKNSNLNRLMVKNLPLCRGTDNIIVEPTCILYKSQIVTYGKEMNSFEYLDFIFKNCIFEFEKVYDDLLIVKVVYKFGD